MLKNKYVKLLLPHLAAIAFFLVLSFSYFLPSISGKVLKQHDISTWKGMSEEVRQFKNETGNVSLWTGSMFGGMPTYLINTPNEKNIIARFGGIVQLKLKQPVAHLFLYLLGFYLALLAFRIKPWLATAGAVAFAFSSYFFIIITAGHVSKAVAIGYMAPVIGGVFLAFDRKPLHGALMMAFFLSLQILTNHMQIVYYTLLTVLIFGIAWIIAAIKKGEFSTIVKPILYSVAGLILAIGINATVINLTYEYGKYSIRGASELSHDQHNKTTGLDKDYATAWSYGIDETFTFLIPNFKGGASGGALSENSETYRLFEQAQGKAQARKIIKQLPLYWGTQPMTSGPVYIGALVCFLFVLGLFFVKGPVKWWLISATILSVLLSWGHNFMWFTNLFLDYFPGYNKFRTVSMTLVIAEFTMPLLGILGLHQLMSGNINKKEFKKAFYWAFGITGGLSLFFAAFAGMYSFAGPGDAGMQQVLVDALQADRMSIFRTDALRSFVFIALGAVLIWAFYEKKIKANLFVPALIVILIIDLWPINKRYLNDSNFAKSNKEVEYTPTMADQYILKDKDPDFRVLNLTVSTFNDASTSFFHKSIGGYHGAKMRRYQELIDLRISGEMQDIAKRLQGDNAQSDAYQAVADQKILRMLNTKYVIINPEAFPLINTAAMGNAWFANNILKAENADEEMALLGTFTPETDVIVNKEFSEICCNISTTIDSSAFIKLVEYKPNYLKYQSKSQAEEVAVFSEIYYPKGWEMLIDGIPAPYFRANYVLRAARIPAGEHTIEWRFEPKGYSMGNAISYASSAILILLALGLLLKRVFFKKKEE